MSVNPYSPPAADVDNAQPVDGAPALWNPSVAGVLSFFLSPIFGALVLMKNWQAMGEPEKARQAKMWIFYTLAFYVVMIGLAVVTPENGAVNLLFRGAGIGFFIAWYMMSAKDQKDVVAYRYGVSFPKRSWLIPVLYAIGIYVGLIVVAVVLIFVLTAGVGPAE